MKTRSRLVQDLKVEDCILLDRPKVSVIGFEKPEKLFSRAPAGRILLLRDRHGTITREFFLNDEKVDTLPRKTLWQRFVAWLDNNHKKHVEKMESVYSPTVNVKFTPFGGTTPRSK